MRALSFVALCLSIFYVAAEYDAAAGAPVGFSFSAVVDGFSLTSPLSAFSYVSSAGFSKLLAVDQQGHLYVMNDLAQVAPTPTTTVPNGVDFAGLDGLIYITINSPSAGGISTLDAAGTVLNTYTLRTYDSGVIGGDLFCQASGIVVNPTNKHLYVSCLQNGLIPSAILDIDPTIFSGQPSGTFTVLEDFDVLVSQNPAALNFQGLAFSSTYSTLYAVASSDDTTSNVFGYDIQQGANKGLVYWSSPLPGSGVGVVAGTGCLDGFIYVAHAAGVSQLDLNGVQTLLLEDQNPDGFGGFLHYDALDGSLLVPAYDIAGGDLLRLVPPQCGGFAGPFRFFTAGEPIGSVCSIDAECSTKNCVLGTPNSCQSGGYLGSCQTNADCVGTDPDGYWCQLYRRRIGDDHDDNDKQHKKKKKHDDDQEPPFVPAPWGELDENFYPARYGICNMNSCAVNHGGCDVQATCIPTGDKQRICKCNEGYYGSGTMNTCVTPCTAGTCDTNALCSSTSLMDVTCTCVSPDYFGAGTPGNCIANPCLDPTKNTCASPADGAQAIAFCSPLTLNTFTCTCGEGYWAPPGVNNPQCIVNPCTNPNACDPHASCTPQFGGSTTYVCTCNDGYAPATMVPNPVCNPSVCTALQPPLFPFFNAFGVVGTCVGLVTGQTCQVGCMDGYSARGQTFTTCTGTVGSTASYYSVPLFECLQDATNGGHHGRHHGDDGDGFNTPDVEQPISAWNCPKAGRCRPGTPFVSRDDTSATLSWLPLGQDPDGGALTELRVSIQPAFGSVTYSPPITNPWYAESLTINNLQHGVAYKFRLVATVSGQYVASDAASA